MLRSLVWLALGTFAIGTEGFMIAGLLPRLSADLGVTVAAAGQLVTVFALVYALGSPLLAVLTAGLERKRLLLWSIGGFGVANLAAAAAPSFAMLMAARILLALSAGQFSPTASGFAGTSVAPHMRGRALAVVVGGVSVAVALGAPLGAWVGTVLNWRATFLGVAGLSALAFLGIAWRLPRQASQGAVGVRDRLRVIATQGVGRTLLVTVLWSTGGFAIYTYVAVLLHTVAGWEGPLVSLALLSFGIGAVIGTFGGGNLVDRFGSTRILLGALIALTLIALNLSVIGFVTSGIVGGVLILATLAVWGVIGWGFFPAQQVRLIGLAPELAPILLSLNQSAMYLGIAGGAVVGALTLRLGSAADVGWVGALFEGSALAVLVWGLLLKHAPAGSAAPSERHAVEMG
jgi:predicted MFS family arabinose efflux permease